MTDEGLQDTPSPPPDTAGPGVEDPEPEAFRAAGRRLQRERVVRRFLANVPATISLVFLVVLCVTALLADVLAPYDFAAQNTANRLQPPSREHLLGTDEFGRDILTRVMMGSRVSLSVGFLSVLILVVVGCTIGLLAGYYRRLDNVLMRFVDMLIAIPNMFLLLLLVALFGRGQGRTIVFIGLTYWVVAARYVRGQVLVLREVEFIQAAISTGASDLRVILRHIIPNVIDGVLVVATLTLSWVIVLESALSFLGLGAQPPTPSWGNMLAGGRQFMRDAWWVTTFPGAAIFFTVMAFNFVGDGIRDAFDMRTDALSSGGR